VSESGRIFGTYVHGFFDNDDLRHAFIQTARAAADLAPAEQLAPVAAKREMRIDRLASHLRESLNISRIKSWVVEPSGRRLENPGNPTGVKKSSHPEMMSSLKSRKESSIR
jgi:adenosylcobyric acid synthase